MVVFSRLELLNQRQLLEQALFGKSLLERQLAYLLSSIRKISFDITTSWKKLMERDKSAMIALAGSLSKESNYIEQIVKIQPEISIATVIKEQMGGLTIPKIQLLEVRKQENNFNIPITNSLVLDYTIESFEGYYNEILKYVDQMITFQRLIKKIKKTRRQLTMLETGLIPELKENIELIRFTLNQRELEDKIRLMKISQKLSSKKSLI